MEERDVERKITRQDLVHTLRRVADAVEKNAPFRIQIAGKRFTVPAGATFSIEHEVEGDSSELEIQFSWTVSKDDDDADAGDAD